MIPEDNQGVLQRGQQSKFTILIPNKCLQFPCHTGRSARPSAAAANDDGALDISDAIKMLLYMFGNITELAPPGAVAPGDDPTADELGCNISQ